MKLFLLTATIFWLLIITTSLTLNLIKSKENRDLLNLETAHGIGLKTGPFIRRV
ncbi:MAG: hypothetical protein JEZ06_09015 [Anaerolineaceae bacterium]|nr:hypothetical protein [Anaerolineaceae bacterium]